MAKKKIKKVQSKSRAVKHEIMVRVVPQEVVPTVSDLSEPIREGKKLTIPKTWLSEKQITRLVEKTPKQYIYQRPGKGGTKWDYVTVSYVQRVLDFSFGFNWDFEIVEHGKEADHVWVLGKLTVYSEDGQRKIVKSQFGRSEVKYKKDSKDLLDYGNDLKAAASDALKKCASMLGIARDIYGKTDYKEESGVTAKTVPDTRTTEQKITEAVATVKDKYSESEFCKGTAGKGCTYGNDVESLVPEVAAYSKKVYGKALCRECQKDAKKK
jgi:hypothetical protein